MMLDNQILLRQGASYDIPQFNKLLEINNMYGKVAAQDCLVAEASGNLLGFVRLEVAQDVTYLRPIVVSTDAQGQGIGKALIKTLLETSSRLRVISRGSALGFYARLGFQPIKWEQVYQPFQQECLDCEYLQSCAPQPMEIHTHVFDGNR